MSIQSAIQAAQGRVSAAYDAIVEKGGERPTTANLAALPDAIAALPSGSRNTNIYAENGNEMSFFQSLLNTGGDNYTFVDNDTEIMQYRWMPNSTTNLYRYLHINKIVSVPSLGFYGANVYELHLPNVTNVSGNGLYSLPHCRLLYVPLLINGVGVNNNLSGCKKLIDLCIGWGATENLSIKFWSPTEALKSDSTSLLTSQDIADGYTNNLQKLLYNIREHIAKKLGATATATITFSAEVGAAIDASADTRAAFPSGWTIAY